MLAAVLQQGRELREVVDGGIEAMQQVRNAAPAIRFLGMPHGRMDDPERLEDLGHHHLPQVGVRAHLALEEAVHRRGQDEGVGAVIAQHVPRPPGVPAIGEGDGQFVLGRPCADQEALDQFRRVFVGKGLVGLPLGPVVADAGGHV